MTKENYFCKVYAMLLQQSIVVQEKYPTIHPVVAVIADVLREATQVSECSDSRFIQDHEEH